jgi:FkbM family methyltransferase
LGVKTQTFKGHEFQVVRGTTHPEYSYFTFEEEERAFRDEHWDVKAGEIVFDVGASYGAYALAACAMGATVHAFEPEPTVYVDLVRNIEINGWGHRCFPVNAGLWNVEGKMHMATYAPHWPAQTITGEYHMLTLDQVVEDLGPDQLDWIKIDVEGAEEQVVIGGMKTLKKFGPRLIVECHTFLDAKLAEKIRWLLPDYHFRAFDRPPCIMLVGGPA